MKKILFVLSMLIWASSLFAQAPQGINYQGVARNNIGAAISKQNIGVQFTVLQSGATKYQEHQTTQTDTFGLYSLVIGNPSATVTNGTFASIPWSGGNLSIQIGIDPLGGSSYTTVATTQLQSVPYALYAGSAGSTSSSGITSVTSNTATIAVTPTGTTSVFLDLTMIPALTPNVYGSSTTIPQITVDPYGRVTNAQNITIAAPASTVSVNAPLSGDGSIGNPISTSTTIAAGTVGSANAIPVITYDQYGRITAVVTQTVSGGDVVIAGTGLTGSTAINNTVTLNVDNTTPMWNASQLQGQNISSTPTPTLNQVLQYNATGQWSPATLPILTGGLPTPTVGSILYSNASNSWTPSNPSHLSTTGYSVSIIDTATVGSFPTLYVQTQNSQGYAIQATNLAGAAIVANSNGPYTIEGNITAGAGDGVAGQVENASFGNAIAGYIETGSSGNAVYGNIDNNINSTGSAGYFTNFNSSNSSPTIFDSTNGTGYSARFIGGKGIQTNQIQITGTASAPPLAGYVLTSDALGNGTWQSGSANNWLTTGNNAGAADFIGTNNTQPLVFKTNGTEAMRIDNVSNWLGIGTTSSLVSRLDVMGNIHASSGKILLGPVGGINQGYTGIYSDTATGDLVLAVFKPGSSGSVGSSNSYDAVTVKGTTGNVGIGTTNPAATLEVDGPSGGGPTLKIVDGNQALGKILTSDGAGNATWQAPVAQVLSLGGNILSISGGNSVTLPPQVVSNVTNGLSLTTGTIELGGTLTNNTTITQNANNMIFNASGGNVQMNNSGAAVTLSVSTTGTGQAGQFFINNTGSNQPALNANTNGIGNAVSGGNISTTTGSGGYFSNNQATNTSPALIATTSGTGNAINASSSGSNPTILSTNGGTTGGAGSFQINTAGNAFPALVAATNGTGSAISASNNGSNGSSGVFQNTTAGNSFPTLNVITNSTAGGPAVFAQTTGSGNGNAINAINNATGGSAGQFQINTAGNASNALSVTTNGGGNAINATSGSGTAINASNSGGNTISAQNTGTTGGAGNFNINNGSNNITALSASTNGTGNTAVFSITNPANGNYALNASTNGTGAAIWATNTGTGSGIVASIPAGSSGPAIFAVANGGGNTAKFQINNTGNTVDAIFSTTNGSGSAIDGSNTGTGIAILGSQSGTAGSAGNFNISNAGNGSNALYATTSGTGNAGYFSINNTSNPSQALFVTTNGTSNAGYFQVNNATGSANALVATTNGGGAAINANTTGSGSAIIASTPAGNSNPVISATSGGGGNSGSFSGGAGLKTDGMTASIVNVSANTTLTGTNYFVLINTGGISITLPLANTNQGRIYILMNPTQNYTLISQAGGGGVISTAGATIVTQGSSSVITAATAITRLVSDGTNWREW